MTIFRIIGVALFYSTQNESVGMFKQEILFNLDNPQYLYKINIDSFVDVSEVITLFAKIGIFQFVD